MKHIENCWTTKDKGKGVRKGSGEGLDWLKHNTFTGKIPRQNSHWTTNRCLSNEGQECKISHANARTLMEEGN
jgi:hypothetical protein